MMRKYKLMAFMFLLFSSITVAHAAFGNSYFYSFGNYTNYDIRIKNITIKHNTDKQIRLWLIPGETLTIMKAGSFDIIGYITDMGDDLGTCNKSYRGGGFYREIKSYDILSGNYNQRCVQKGGYAPFPWNYQFSVRYNSSGIIIKTP